VARRHPCHTRRPPRLASVHDYLRKAIAARGLDALVVTALPNILYLTNFTGSSAIAVVTPDVCISSPTSGTSQ